jgi:Recombinase
MVTMAIKGARASAKVRQQSAAKRRDDLFPVIEDLKAKGVTSLRALADELNSAGLTSARGGRWTATQVMRILNS